jgi:hypothetical protein
MFKICHVQNFKKSFYDLFLFILIILHIKFFFQFKLYMKKYIGNEIENLKR